MSTATTRRADLADAAIGVLAAEGMRGLTHRAVDRRAALPEGSCSYYFRTRQALLEAAVHRLAELDEDAIATATALPDRVTADELAVVLTRLVELATTTQRDRHLARYELALEATRRPELRAVLITLGARHRDLAVALLTRAGAAEPPRQGPDLVACLDGLIFDSVAGAGARPFDRAATERSVRDLVAAVIPGSGEKHR